jgi:hypothetical protein
LPKDIDRLPDNSIIPAEYGGEEANMTPRINQYLNKTILVSIPHLFHDERCRALTLLGAEPTGLWLQSDELAKKLLPEDRQIYASAGPVVFVPFAQIAGVLVVTGAPTSQTLPSAAAAPTRAAKSKPKASLPDDAKKSA